MTLSRTKINATAARSLLGRAKDAPLTYEAVGMSLGKVDAPAGFRELNESRVVGKGQEAFNNIGYGLMHWDVHRRAKMFVQPEFNVVRTDDCVAVAVPTVPFLSNQGACRVVDVVATGDSIGWSYGTLPGHPECGEESFVLTHLPNDDVVLTIRAFSKPAKWYVKVAGPIARGIQKKVANRLLDGAATLATVDPLSLMQRST